MLWYKKDSRTITASLTPVEAMDKIDSLVDRARELADELGIEAGKVKAQWVALQQSGGGRDDHAAALLANLGPKLAEIATFADNCGTQIRGWSTHPFGKQAMKAEIEDITEEGLSVEEDVGAKDVDPDELAMGIQVEYEHTGNKDLARKITLDHLAEIPDYYTRLKKMEDRAKKEAKP